MGSTEKPVLIEAEEQAGGQPKTQATVEAAPREPLFGIIKKITLTEEKVDASAEMPQQRCVSRIEKRAESTGILRTPSAATSRRIRSKAESHSKKDGHW